MWHSSLEHWRPMELGDFFMMATWRLVACLEDDLLWRRSIGHLGGGH
jgi:hypothetical protein